MALQLVKVNGTAMTELPNLKKEASPHLPFREYVFPLVYQSEA